MDYREYTDRWEWFKSAEGHKKVIKGQVLKKEKTRGYATERRCVSSGGAECGLAVSGTGKGDVKWMSRR